MSRKVTIRGWATEDLRNAFGFIGQDSIEQAIRFLQAAENTFNSLAQMPGVGKPRKVNKPELAELRQWPVDGFSKYLIFYLATDEEVFIVRVLHGSRDIDSILMEDIDVEGLVDGSE